MKELDLSGVRVYTKNDIVDVVGLIGKKVYVSNAEDFGDGDVREYGKFRLAGVLNNDKCFVVDTLSGSQLSYKYLILEEDAKFKEGKEKNLRPFKNISEFKHNLGCAVGNAITYKRKDRDTEYTVIFNGYSLINGEVLVVYLGTVSYTLDELLINNCLFYKDGEWKPFGVEK